MDRTKIGRACSHLGRGVPKLLTAGIAGLFLSGLTGPARALTIQPIYASSITSLSNAATIENAFQAVINVFDAEFATPITVKIGVGWGSVNGHALPSGDIGASMQPLLGTFAYADVRSALQGLASNPLNSTLKSLVAHLPAKDPSGLGSFEIPYAEAQAFGYLAPKIGLDSGFIGFKARTAFDYNPADGIAAGAYDFQGLAAHEIAEVLGRYSGLPSGGSASYATPFDLLRFTAPGVQSFNSSAHAYASVDGGKTNLGAFNYSGGGDRGDWLGSMHDAFNAYFSTGVAEPLTGADLTVLDALGYGSWKPSKGLGVAYQTTAFAQGGGAAAVPEPAAWAMMLLGFGAIGGAARRRTTAAEVLARG